MSPFDSFRRERRRRILLDVMADVPDGCSHHELTEAANAIGCVTSRIECREELVWLSEQSPLPLVRLERLEPPGQGEPVYMAYLTTHGEDVARGRALHAGIPRRGR